MLRVCRFVLKKCAQSLSAEQTETESEESPSVGGESLSEPEGESEEEHHENLDAMNTGRFLIVPAAGGNYDEVLLGAVLLSVPGEYIVGLTVNDGIEDSSEDFVAVQVTSAVEDTGDSEVEDTGTFEGADTGE